MKERDALVEALGRKLRHQADAEDPRWAELERGELSPEAIDALIAASPLDPAREEALIERARAPRAAPIRRRPRPAWIALAFAAAMGGALGAFLLGARRRRRSTRSPRAGTRRCSGPTRGRARSSSRRGRACAFR